VGHVCAGRARRGESSRFRFWGGVSKVASLPLQAAAQACMLCVCLFAASLSTRKHRCGLPLSGSCRPQRARPRRVDCCGAHSCGCTRAPRSGRLASRCVCGMDELTSLCVVARVESAGGAEQGLFTAAAALPTPLHCYLLACSLVAFWARAHTILPLRWFTTC
jgi:hypothetical protein